MIHIDRSATPVPGSLAEDGDADLPRIEKLVEEGRLDSRSFDKKIYAAEAVKDALWKMQHHKCCFCEGGYEKKWSTVDHFRPKTEAIDSDGSKTLGYWWLAYDFRNLYFACPNCNTPKGSHFPLVPGSSRLVAKQTPWAGDQDVALEDPLLIDPGYDEPAEHLTFAWIPGGDIQIAPRDGSVRGKETIRAAKLDRDDLTTLRNTYYSQQIVPTIKKYHRARRSDDGEAAQRASNCARRLTGPDYPYALLAKVAFEQSGML